jgi:hypothetical protein
MAATVTINEHNSATPDIRTDKTSGTVRCRATDSAVVDASNPLAKPGAGLFTRSFEKWLQLRIGGTGPGGVIQNLQFYTTGGAGGGATVYARTTNPTVYATPAVPANDAAGTIATTYTAGARKSMGAGPYSAINTNIGDFLVLWMKLDDTVVAPQSPTSSLNLFVSYDES